MGAELHRDLMPTLHRPHRGGGVLGGAGQLRASLSRPPSRVRVGRCPPALRAVGSPLRRKAAPHHPGGSLSPVEPAAAVRVGPAGTGLYGRVAVCGWPRWGVFGVQDRPRAGRCVGGATGSAGGGPRSGVPAGAGPCARGAGTVRRPDGPSVTGSGCCRRRPGPRRRRLGGQQVDFSRVLRPLAGT